MTRKKRIFPDHILDAAERLLLERGAYSLTLDMVAAEAGISKGGLTYTFATKEALLSALLDRRVARFRIRLRRLRKPGPAQRYPELGNLLDICRNDFAADDMKVGAVLAALQYSPASLRSARAYFKWMLSKFSENTEEARRARLVFYAAQGLFLLQGFGLVTLTAAKRKLIVEDLVSFLAAPMQ